MKNKTLDLETLLPHRAPMLLLSEAVDYGEDFAKALVHITPDSPFFDVTLGGVPSWVGMEYMAQTIGIWSGYQQLKKNPVVHAGFLLGSRRYECNSPIFPAGCTLQLSAKLVYHDDGGLGAFDCLIEGNQVIEGNKIFASAQIKAFSPENPQDFVRPFSQHNKESST
jgi:predicted hotdog family 3-hydroxylacyl-ACP dehydratase